MRIKSILAASAASLVLAACTTTATDMDMARTSTAAAPMADAGDMATAEPAELASLIDEVEIPYEKFTLENGLDVIVHTARKAPIVAVAVWYNVGSKDEPNG